MIASTRFVNVVLRVLAWCLFHREGLRIADGPPRRDVPDLAVVGLDGKAVAWYGCGSADAEELRHVIVHNKGVDVRVLVPSRYDHPWIRLATRHFYRRLLRNGVRIWEWRGEMMHAKTSVVDGRCTRSGSTDYNP